MSGVRVNIPALRHDATFGSSGDGDRMLVSRAEVLALVEAVEAAHEFRHGVKDGNTVVWPSAAPLDRALAAFEFDKAVT